MGLLSFLKSKSPAPTSPAAADDATEQPPTTPASGTSWRRSEFDCFPAGYETHLASIGGAQPVSLPSFVVDFLLSCDEFQPLETHLAAHAETHHWTSLQIEALTSWLPKVIEAGLLISSENLIERCARMRDATVPPPVELIGFPTGGKRTAMLERCLSSFAANLRTHGREPELLVTDSSSSPEDRAAFRALLARLKREQSLRLRYAGEEEKRRFAAVLVERSGCRASSVEFALFDPWQAGFTCGANRNLLLLHEAGRMTISVDDDVLCEIAPMPPAKERVTIFAHKDPFERWFFPDRESALAASPFADVDFLAAHESLLGREIGALFPPDLGADEIDVSCIDDPMLERIARGPVRLRTTFFGQVGDAGTPTSCYYFYARDQTLRRLTENEEHYRAAFSSRSVVAAVKCPSIGGGWLAPGMTIGLDHRELLPPFFPVLHAEDTIFAAATWICCGDSATGHLPFALHHDSGKDKVIHQPRHLTADDRATVFEFAFIVRTILFALRPPQHADNAARMRALGRNLTAFAARPAEDFLRDFRRIVLRMEAEKLAYLEDRLREETEAPDYWRRDVEAFVTHSHEALTHADFDIPFDLKRLRSDEENRTLMQQLLVSYGELLEDWPDIVTAARELRESGYVFSAEVTTD